MSSSTSYPRPTLLGAFIGALSFVHADLCLTTNPNPSGTGCVDPQGFLSCYQAQGNQAGACVNLCNKDTDTDTKQQCILGYGGYQLTENIGCWIQSCWNQAYSCEYQGTAIQYLVGTDLVQSSVHTPFYPPPDGASGACSCSLSYVYGNQTYIQMNDSCLNAATGNTEYLANCTCCFDSLPVSNILNACPKSDLSVLDFQSTISDYQKIISQLTTDNCAILDTDPGLCVSDLGIQKDGPVWYNPLNLPAGEPGTEQLSNMPGTPFTEFGAASYTLELFPSFTSVITPAPFNAQNAAATQSGTLQVVANCVTAGTAASSASAGGGSAATGAATAGGTGSNTGPTKPSKTSGALKADIPLPIWSCAIIAAVLCNVALL